MTTLLLRDTTSGRPLDSLLEGHMGTSPHVERPVERIASEHSGHAAVLRRERLFAAIRLSRVLDDIDVTGRGAVVDFATFVVVDGTVHDLHCTAMPGFFPVGHHMVVVKGRIGSCELTGRFELSIGEHFGVNAATWSAVDANTGLRTAVPAELAAQLPTSAQVDAGSVVGAVRRAHLAAERARAELLQSNRGLVRAVVNRFRGVIRAESASIDLGDLTAVGEHHLLEVVDRWFTDPNTPPVRDVAWSKLVQRAIGNALRTEIARATGISVEFRQLLAWFHSHPEDRSAAPAEVARKMAFAAGVTRIMSRRGLHDRAAGAAVLEQMLVDGQAAYVAPGRDAAATARHHRANGVFVISPRSSLAEIERAQHFNTTGALALDVDDDVDGYVRGPQLSMHDAGYDRADDIDVVRRLIEATGMTPLEAMVWLQRTGALDPGGHATELPDIAEDLGLQGRAEARAALRRARRKLDAWTASAAQSNTGVREFLGRSLNA